MHHIVLISTSYPDEAPGSEAAGSFVADFAEELAKTLRVTVVSPSRNASLTKNGALNVLRFAVPRLPLSLLNPLNPVEWAAIFRTLIAGRTALVNVLRDQQADHVFALWALPSGWWARSVATSAGIPYSIWALGSDIWSLGRLPVASRLLRKVLRDAKCRFADGLALCSEVEMLGGKPCTFLPSVRRMPDRRTASVGNRAPYKVAFLGRWHKNKGTDLLMRALEQLQDEDWERIREVRIFGGGPLESDVHGAAARLLGEKRPVVTGGYLDRQDAAELLGWADYLLLPSRIESVPVVFSDAVQLGTPVVATPVGDLPELHAETGFGVLAKRATVEDYTVALRSAIRQDASTYAVAVRAARSRFDVSESCSQFLDAIERD